MSPVLVAGPAVEPVSLAEAKAHLRLDTGDEDALVGSLVVAARHTLELATRRAFVAQTWRLVLDRWPEGRAVALPLAPIIAVTALRVSPLAGSAVTLSPTLYRLDGGDEPPRLVAGASVPDPGLPSGGIEIEATGAAGSISPRRTSRRRRVSRRAMAG